MPPCVRFDDHTPGAERSFAIRGLQETIVARSLDDVLPALEAVERAVQSGKWAGGYVAYEAAPAFDRALRVALPEQEDGFDHLPLVWFGIFDRLEDLEPFRPRGERMAPYHVSAWKPSVTAAEYLDAVGLIHELIAAGDTYQVNHTFRLRAAYSGNAYELYRDLVLAQRGSFAAYLDTGRYRVLSASPEQFFRLEGTTLSTRPMKGTIRRGRWPLEDQMLGQRLQHSEKDRAENLMIVDLLRNDLGRIAEVGTVRVDELLELERYETVWQLTSLVTSQVPVGTGPTDVFKALFPSGSVTGAPKARTMEIIASLERFPRGVYCGAIGYLAPPGSGHPTANFNVAIRTVVLDQEEGVAQYGTGGGITWDSRPASEYEEALLKAEVLTTRRVEFGLIETMRFEPAAGLRWRDEHLARMAGSAEYFGFPFDAAAAMEALDAAADGVSETLALRLKMDDRGRFDVLDRPLDMPEFCEGPDFMDGTVRLAISTDPVSSRDVFLFHKTTNRRVYDQRLAAHPDCDDVILVNERGEVTETTIANIVVKFGTEWWTPRLDAGLLPGIYRARLLEEGVIRERSIALSELSSADGIALVNSVRGWRRGIVHDAIEPHAEGLASLG